MLTTKTRRLLLTTMTAAALSIGATGVAGAALPAAPSVTAPAVVQPPPWKTNVTLLKSQADHGAAAYVAAT